MALSEERVGAVMVVRPEGRLDSATAGPFGDRLSALVREGATRVVVDLRGVAYVTSAGFRALLINAKLVGSAAGRMVITGVTPEVQRLFEMGGFTELFVIVASRDDAIARAGA
jgi:anti-anti-sigma factor